MWPRVTVVSSMPACINAILLVALSALAGCSGGKPKANVDLHVAPETLIGRRNVMAKDAAEDNPGAHEVTGVAGEKHKMSWEFKADHHCEMNVEASMGPATGIERKATTEFAWTASRAKGDTLVIEFSYMSNDQPSPANATVVFQSNDRCTYDAGNGEAFVMTRQP